jgi:hypothetical protein
MEGVGLRAGYMLSDAAWVYLTYAYAWPNDSSVETSGASEIAINPLDQFQIFQSDLNMKF